MKDPLLNIKKRQIWKSFVEYPAAAFVILQAVDCFITKYDLNPKSLTLSLILLIGGFIISVLWNWNHGEKGAQDFSIKERVTYGIIIATTLLCGAYLLNIDVFYTDDLLNNPRFIALRKKMKFK